MSRQWCLLQWCIGKLQPRRDLQSVAHLYGKPRCNRPKSSCHTPLLVTPREQNHLVVRWCTTVQHSSQ